MRLVGGIIAVLAIALYYSLTYCFIFDTDEDDEYQRKRKLAKEKKRRQNRMVEAADDNIARVVPV